MTAWRWFGARLPSRAEPMPARFNRLATYNAERHRGIVHTPEYDAEMAALQAEFGNWINEFY